MNLLPDGLCISAPDGTVLLSNLKINALCRALTGGSLADAGRFVRALRERGEAQGDSILVRTEEGAVWLFTQKQLTTGGKRYNQLTAVDVTERYRIIDELREKNGRLQDIQRRMRAVSDWSADMFVAREEAAARAALHNQLGQVLLMGRHCLQHPESTEAAIVYMTTAQMNAFLLGEAEEPEPRQADALQNALLLAQSIGVTVTLRGAPPEDAARRELLALAIRECAANAVKHAEADALDMTISPCHPYRHDRQQRSAAEGADRRERRTVGPAPSRRSRGRRHGGAERADVPPHADAAIIQSRANTHKNRAYSPIYTAFLRRGGCPCDHNFLSYPLKAASKASVMATK